MKVSVAMVVCFVGFPGIVPEAGSPADATTFEAARAFSSPHSVEDASTPHGSVGASLLVPLGMQDALDPLAVRTAVGTPTHDRELTTTSTAAVKRPASGTLFAPVAALVPTSSFGLRTSPITGEADEFHTGQDYAAPCGTTVFAADAGVVRAVGWHAWGGGNRVEVDHGNGLITTYNHLQGISVRPGDQVGGGDPIAALGTTGSSTGCHLHFETILDGEHVDPLRWKLVHTAAGPSHGELKDYSPADGSASDIPVWAQSSTRSEQPLQVSVPLPVTAGPVPVPDGMGIAAGAQPVPDRIVVVPSRPAPPADASPRPEQPPVVVIPEVTTPPKAQESPVDPGSSTPPANPGPSTPPPGGHVTPQKAPKPPVNPGSSTPPVKTGPSTTQTPRPGDTSKPTTKPPVGESVKPETVNPETTKPVEHDTSKDDGVKPDVPDPAPDTAPDQKNETPGQADPAPTDPAVSSPVTPEVPAPSCDVDPADTPVGEEPELSPDVVAQPVGEVHPQGTVLPESALADPAATVEQASDPAGAPGSGTEADSAAEETTGDHTAGCGDPESIPATDAAVPAPGQPEDAAAVAARSQG